MFPELLFPHFGSFYFPSSAFSFCPTLFFLSSLGQQEWDLQNCFARFEFTEPGVREKYKLSLHAKWKSWERSPEAVLSGLLSSRQKYLQAINSTCTDSLIWWRLFFYKLHTQNDLRTVFAFVRGTDIYVGHLL